MRTLVKKALTLPLMVLAACLILFEDLVWDKITVLVGMMARWHLVARLERWVLARGRYATLALFAVPISALVPIKLIAVYQIVSGHAFTGLMVIIIAKLTGTAISARLFVIAKPKLMTFETFVKVYAAVLRFKDWARRVLADLRVREALASVRARVRALSQRQREPGAWSLRRVLVDRLMAARRLLRKTE